MDLKVTAVHRTKGTETNESKGLKTFRSQRICRKISAVKLSWQLPSSSLINLRPRGISVPFISAIYYNVPFLLSNFTSKHHRENGIDVPAPARPVLNKGTASPLVQLHCIGF